MVSLLRYFLCLITVIVAAEAAWGGWRGGAVTSPYYGCVYGYPYCANYCYGYGYLYVYGPYIRRHFHAAVRGVRRVEAYRSAATARTATTQVPSSPSKTVQATAARSASPWTPMTVPISASPVNEPAKTDVNSTEWTKNFELRLNQLSPDMRAASALIEQEGFKVDSGNKSATGWFLTAHDKDQRSGSIRLQSDGTKIDLTVAGGKDDIRY